ncbi:MAG TPA: hypothetical protein VM869_24850 [Enhygromyxa sp.]|nr:hypothetical protein [Enhygromyxa sp.]
MDCFRDDYPAAHSMDTSWFAADEHGRVAVFDSDEHGAVPHAAISLGGAGDPDPEADEICKLLALDEDGYDAIYESGPFFHYRNGDCGDPGHYERTDHAPAQPVNVAALPGPLRAKMLRLPVDFTTAATLHLADFMTDGEADIWGDSTLRGEPLGSSNFVPGSSSTGNRSGVGWVVVIVLALAAALLAGILTAG